MTNADTSRFKIVDDPEIDKVVEAVRAEYLAQRNFDRLDVVILIPNSDGTWRRGGFNREALAYPASCVKLAYMAAAMKWCRENNRPPDFLDAAVRPMIVKSDNVQTGVVVDTISGAENSTTLTQVNEGFKAWHEKRRYTEKFLEEHGLLGNQTLRHKTYPTNSGDDPAGAEKLAREYYGMNKMEPRLSASLMLEIVKGALEPQATDYMRSLLRRDRFGEGSAVGWGLPPGSTVESKAGLAYDTAEDIAYCVLPNGKEFVAAIFTNGRDQAQRAPHDLTHLGVFFEMLIERLGLTEGCPPVARIDNTDETRFRIDGAWTKLSDQKDAYGGSYYSISGGDGKARAIWMLNPPEAGRYEVAIWFPGGDGRAKSVPVSIVHADGTAELTIDQQAANGRWIRLGDFRFNSGAKAGSVSVANAAPPNTRVLADAVRIAKWPDDAPATETAAPPAGKADRETPVGSALPDDVAYSAEVIGDNDDGSPTFRISGKWSEVQAAHQQGKTARAAIGGQGSIATWIVELPETGLYEVSVSAPTVEGMSRSNAYDVRAMAGTQRVVVSLAEKDGKWVSLGRHRFRKGKAAVALDAAVGTKDAKVVADAMRFGRVVETAATASNVAPENTTPAGDRRMHVASVVPSVQIAEGGTLQARVNVKIVDQDGKPVADVEVSGSFLGMVNESATAKTNVAGLAILRAKETRAGPLSYTFCVDRLVHPSAARDASADVNACQSYKFQD